MITQGTYRIAVNKPSKGYRLVYITVKLEVCEIHALHFTHTCTAFTDAVSLFLF